MNPASAPPNLPSLLWQPASITEHLQPEALFPSLQPLEIEIGSGDGSFLAAYAKAHPETNFFGLERLLGRIRKLEKKARRNGSTNMRLVRLEASYFIKYILPTKSVQAFHIYFPDPWPKRRHWKNRLVNSEFTEYVQRPLSNGGCIFLRTDNEPYFAQMRDVFSTHPKFEPFPTPPDLLEFKTDFERNFNQRGIPTLHLALRLKPT